jgi:hypothetical protein
VIAAGQPREEGRAAGVPLQPAGLSLSGAGLDMGLRSGEDTQAPSALQGAVCPLLTPAGEELTVPQGPGAGTNGSAYRCLLIKEPSLLCLEPPFWVPWKRLELGASLRKDSRKGCCFSGHRHGEVWSQ